MQLKIPIIDFQINVESQLGVSEVGEVGESSIEIHIYIFIDALRISQQFVLDFCDGGAWCKNICYKLQLRTMTSSCTLLYFATTHPRDLSVVGI